MIRVYFHPTPKPAKVALLLEEVGLDYELIPVDTGKGEQHLPAFTSINPNGKVPAIIDTEGPGGVAVRVFDCSAILHYLGDKYKRLIGTPSDRAELLSWLFFLGTGLGSFSARRCIFSTRRPKSFLTRSTDTGAKSSVTIACSTSTWPSAITSSATIIRLPTFLHGDGSTARRAFFRAKVNRSPRFQSPGDSSMLSTHAPR